MSRHKQLRSLLAHFPDLTLKGARDVKITGVTNHSKEIAPGYLFIARKGALYDGAHYIFDAVQAGAAAIATDLFNPSLPLPQVITSNLTLLEGDLADAFYGHPSQKLKVFGITGTSGKTSTSYLIRHLLNHCQIPSGLIGGVEVITGEKRFSTGYTTPCASTIHHLLAEMKDNGCKAAILEATSHGLTQKRLHRVAFDTAIFTNLSREHLDYHPSMEAYAAAKATLFENVPKGVLNGDDPWHTKMQGALCPFTYGLTPPCNLYASHLKTTLKGTHFTLHYQGEKREGFIPLVGTFNLYNTLAALSACLLEGLSLPLLLKALPTFPPVPGRLEKVPNKRNLSIYIDFAHKPDALEKVLQTLRNLKPKRVITVVGCGGDRDKGKRPLMGKIASTFSDIAIFTSDNPRSEDPKAICQEMAKGGVKGEIIVDRREAIAHAVEIAKEGDCILIAGKGHEMTQIFAHGAIPFDDRVCAQEVCE